MNCSEIRKYAKEIATELLPILKGKNYCFQLYFYNFEGKSIYIENDLVDNMVYVKHINIDYNMPYTCRCNIDRLDLDILIDMLVNVYMAINFLRTNKIAEKVNSIRTRIKEINEIIL